MAAAPGPIDPEVLEGLLADSSELAGVLDQAGRLRYLNPAGRRLLGLPASGPVPDVVAFDLVADLDRPVLEVALLPALADQGHWSGNLNVLTAGGTEVPTRSTFRRHDGTTTWAARDLSTERAVYDRLHKKVFEDEATGLPHRSIFLDRLDLSLRRPPDSPPITLLLVSLDRFAERTERLPATAPSALLHGVGERLDRLRGPRDAVARWGDEEFVVLCHPDTADGAPERVLASFAEPFVIDGHEVHLAASVGLAVGRPGAVTTDQLLRHADAASQLARQRPGSVQQFDEEMQARVLRRTEVEEALRGAAGRDELVLHYQPEVSLRTNQIVAVEALVRWQHPGWGLVSPGEFVPIAEASSLILEVGQWVLRTAMHQCAAWRSTFGDRAPAVAVNISPRQFAEDDFVERVAELLVESGAEAGDLCFEITESILMDDVELTLATLGRLKALGLQLAVDDFGTGYSSLSYLRRFPVDILKVDQTFVSGLGHDPEDSAIVQAVVHMGRALRLTTVAEGVETGHHLIELRELDCDVAQGYHFARPRPSEAIDEMLAAGADWLTVV